MNHLTFSKCHYVHNSHALYKTFTFISLLLLSLIIIILKDDVTQTFTITCYVFIQIDFREVLLKKLAIIRREKQLSDQLEPNLGNDDIEVHKAIGEPYVFRN